ncbi:hypothetical protein SAMN05444162_5015 [Paenibacillaceae bacterium GAS479]|nr:hypothetical protein SAMN05444162_5015 [Paenibacillaceae bacterium GAS479]
MYRTSYKTLFSLTIVVLIIVLIVVYIGKPERVSNRFAQNLFNYPLPAETTLLEKKQYNGRNWVGGGSGGYWSVIAYIKLNTKLSQREIVRYYKLAGEFPYPDPDNNIRGVQPEIYFEDNRKLIEASEGTYYLTERGSHQAVETIDKMDQEGAANEVIVQIVSGFKYFQID